jgi:hypothetical protein
LLVDAHRESAGEDVEALDAMHVSEFVEDRLGRHKSSSLMSGRRT